MIKNQSNSQNPTSNETTFYNDQYADDFNEDNNDVLSASTIEQADSADEEEKHKMTRLMQQISPNKNLLLNVQKWIIQFILKIFMLHKLLKKYVVNVKEKCFKSVSLKSLTTKAS